MKRMIFVSDMFAEQYVGGAELTTEAIMSYAPSGYEIAKINSNAVNQSIIDENKDSKFIICNFASLPEKSKIYFCKNANYDIVEYDYKFCKYRSLQKHEVIENKPCDCITTFEGKINSAFYGYAKKIWFMSHNQKQIFINNVKTIKEDKCEVLSSVFTAGDLRFIDNIKDNEKNDTYVILNSNSWIKGTRESVEYAKANNLNYEMIGGINYHEMLIKLSTSKGLIFQPLGSDTCPRIVIEAKLLGCDLILNSNVQHKDEEWFTSDYDKCVEYIKSRPTIFWRRYEQQ